MIKPNLIALVDKIEKLKKPNEGVSLNEPEIKLTIARLEVENGSKSPRNYSHRYDEKRDVAGGFFARIFSYYSGAKDKTEGLFAYYGPNISYGGQADYESAAKAFAKIAKKMDQFYQERGNPVDAAESMGRWLEACNITEVWSRPDGASECGWLSKGDWRIETIGAFVGRMRNFLPD